MYKEERYQIRQMLSRIAKSGGIQPNYQYYAFGVNTYLQAIIEVLSEEGITLSGVIDNDKKKQGSFYNGVKIIDISGIEMIKGEKNRFIICSVFWKEMRTQLLKNGVSEQNVISLVLKTFGESWKENVRDVLKGRKLYRKIVKEFPEHRILLCPYTGTGDIYLIGTFLNQYLEKEHIKDYVFVVVSNACKKVADIFPIPKVYQIEGPEACRSLSKYYLLCSDECDITFLNDSWGDIYTNPVQWLRGLHGMDFTEMFRRFTFRLCDQAVPEHPVFKTVDADLNKVVSEANMKKGKTVILAPYATTLVGMPSFFWVELAKKLQAKGYVVCTNGFGDLEPTIEGTVKVSFPLNIAPQLTEWAGGFIGVRSGLCDIISGAKAKKVILYDKSNYFFNCTAYEYFSLRKMKLCEDAIEIEFDNQKLDQYIQQIVDVF